jgi:hexosaminidase
MWGETVPTISDAEYMVFPRLLALSEIGWSPAAQRTSEQSPAYQDFIGRLAEQGARLQTAGVNFYPTPEVPWGLDLSVAQPTLGPGLTIGGTLATLSAPGRATSAVNATIQWGDGTSSTGTVTGAAATGTTVNGLYSIGGDHRYGQAGVYLATVTTTASGTAPASVSFFVRVG